MLILREVRNQKRITLEELAEKTGISRRMISAYESHQNDITFTRMKQFADALGVFVLELTSEYVKPEPQQEAHDFDTLIEKLKEKEDTIKKQDEFVSLYRKHKEVLEEQIKILDQNNSLLHRNNQFLEEKTYDLKIRIGELECYIEAKSKVNGGDISNV